VLYRSLLYIRTHVAQGIFCIGLFCMYALTIRKVSSDFFIGIGLFCIGLFCVYALTLRKVSFVEVSFVCTCSPYKTSLLTYAYEVAAISRLLEIIGLFCRI